MISYTCYHQNLCVFLSFVKYFPFVNFNSFFCNNFSHSKHQNHHYHYTCTTIVLSSFFSGQKPLAFTFNYTKYFFTNFFIFLLLKYTTCHLYLFLIIFYQFFFSYLSNFYFFNKFCCCFFLVFYLLICHFNVCSIFSSIFLSISHSVFLHICFSSGSLSHTFYYTHSFYLSLLNIIHSIFLYSLSLIAVLTLSAIYVYVFFPFMYIHCM